MAMKHAQIGIAAVALGILATVTAAQAEIICTNRGCWETGLTILNHGGVGVGLPYTYNRDATHPKAKKGQRVRVIRETW